MLWFAAITLSLFLQGLDSDASEVRELPLRHETKVSPMALTHAEFAPDGKTLATTGHDGSLRLWNTETWEVEHTLTGNQSPLWTVAFAPDGKTLAMAGDFEVMVYERKKQAWELEESLPVEGMGQPKGGSVFDLVFANKGKSLFVGTFEGAVDVWDTKKWKLVDQCKEHRGQEDGQMIEFLHFHPDGKTLLAGGKTLQTRLLRHGKIPKPEGKAKKQSKTRKKGWTTVHAIPEPKRDDGHPTHRMCGQFSPDGKWLALGGTDGLLQVFDGETYEERQSLSAHTGYSAALAFHPNQALLFTAGKDLKLWDTQEWQVTALTPMPAQAQHLSVAPDGQTIAIAGTDGTLRIYGMPAATTGTDPDER